MADARHLAARWGERDIAWSCATLVPNGPRGCLCTAGVVLWRAARCTPCPCRRGGASPAVERGRAHASDVKHPRRRRRRRRRAVPCAQKRLQSSTEGVVYPLQPDQREFFCIVKKVNDARNHEDKIIIFFLHIVTGNGGLWQVSEAPKYFGGGLKKRTKFSLPPLTPPHELSLHGSSRTSLFSTGYLLGHQSTGNNFWIPNCNRVVKHRFLPGHPGLRGL